MGFYRKMMSEADAFPRMFKPCAKLAGVCCFYLACLAIGVADYLGGHWGIWIARIGALFVGPLSLLLGFILPVSPRMQSALLKPGFDWRSGEIGFDTLRAIGLFASIWVVYDLLRV